MSGRKKIYTDAELRAHKNERARQHYSETKGKRKAYFAARHETLKATDTEYMERMREKSAKFRTARPEVIKAQNLKRRTSDPEKARKESREWFAKNPEKRAAYQQNRRAKIRKVGGKLSPDIKVFLFNAQRGKCVACQTKITAAKAHLDHIIPLALNGPNKDLNAQLLCQTCNCRKRSKHPIDFMQENGFLL